MAIHFGEIIGYIAGGFALITIIGSKYRLYKPNTSKCLDTFTNITQIITFLLYSIYGKVINAEALLIMNLTLFILSNFALLLKLCYENEHIEEKEPLVIPTIYDNIYV